MFMNCTSGVASDRESYPFTLPAQLFLAQMANDDIYVGLGRRRGREGRGRGRRGNGGGGRGKGGGGGG